MVPAVARFATIDQALSAISVPITNTSTPRARVSTPATWAPSPRARSPRSSRRIGSLPLDDDASIHRAEVIERATELGKQSESVRPDVQHHQFLVAGGVLERQPDPVAV